MSFQTETCPVWYWVVGKLIQNVRVCFCVLSVWFIAVVLSLSLERLHGTGHITNKRQREVKNSQGGTFMALFVETGGRINEQLLKLSDYYFASVNGGTAALCTWAGDLNPPSGITQEALGASALGWGQRHENGLAPRGVCVQRCKVDTPATG